MHRGDHRHQERLETCKQRAIFRFLWWSVELADIGTGEERTAFTAQHHGLYAGQRRHLIEPARQACAHRGRDRIDRRIVDRDDGNIGLARNLNEVLQHMFSREQCEHWLFYITVMACQGDKNVLYPSSEAAPWR